MEADRTHILVVDDLFDMADSTAEVLNLWGYAATACYNGAQALVCANIRPAAVLLDLVMPQMDGFQFARAFRGLPGCGTIPLVAISGYSSSACSARAREAGIGYCLPKPVDLALLKALLIVITRGVVLPSGLRVAKRRTPWRLRSRRPAATCAASARQVSTLPVAED